MIPKIVHYCWYGGKPKPPMVISCIRSWRKYLPDWTFVGWNESNSEPMQSCKYFRDALTHKGYAFVSDYARLFALNRWGGVYLDTDLELFRSLAPFLENEMFTSNIIDRKGTRTYSSRIDSFGELIDENKPYIGFGLQSPIIGAEKGHWFIKELLDYYENLQYSTDEHVIIDAVMAELLYKHGFKYIDEEQNIDGVHIYPTKLFQCYRNIFSKGAVSMHWCMNSWGKSKNVAKRIMFKFPAAFKVYRSAIDLLR